MARYNDLPFLIFEAAMNKKRIPSEIEKRLSEQVFAKVANRPRVDPVQADLDRYNDAVQEEIKSINRRAEQQRALMKYLLSTPEWLTWVFRIGGVLMALVVLVYAIGIALLAVQGQMYSITKGKHPNVLIGDDPVLFWLALVYHLFILYVLGMMAYRGLIKWKPIVMRR
jgi:hypothetical protein